MPSKKYYPVGPGSRLAGSGQSVSICESPGDAARLGVVSPFAGAPKEPLSSIAGLDENRVKRLGREAEIARIPLEPQRSR